MPPRSSGINEADMVELTRLLCFVVFTYAARYVNSGASTTARISDSVVAYFRNVVSVRSVECRLSLFISGAFGPVSSRYAQ